MHVAPKMSTCAATSVRGKKKEKEKKKGDKHIAAHLSGIRARARVCIAFASSFINLWSMRPWRASHI
jgi:hypothetical protein